MGLTIKPEPFGLGKIKYFMHVQGEIWDNRAREYEISLNFGHLSLYRVELRYRRQRLREDISAWVKYLEELNPVECVYQTQWSIWDGYYELNLKHFKVSSTLTLKYSKPKPLRPKFHTSTFLPVNILNSFSIIVLI